MSASVYEPMVEHWERPYRQTCPECHGLGYTTIEVREAVTLYDQEWPVTVPATCYKTRPCWRCRGARMVRGER